MMRSKSTVISICVILVLVISLVLAACAPAAPTPGAPTRITPQVPGQKQQAPVTVTPTVPAPAKPAPAPAAEVLTWKFSPWYPAGNENMTVLIPRFEAMIEEMSNGRLIINTFADGTLVAAAESIEACGAGMIELAMDAAYMSGTVPVSSIMLGSVEILRNATQAETLLYELGLNDLLAEGFAPLNVIYLPARFSCPPECFLTKDPIYHVEDWVGVKLRTYGFTADVLTKLGAAPTYFAWGEIYTALSTGVIDAMEGGGIEQNYGMGFHEPCNYIITPPYMRGPGNPITVNTDVWNDTPKDLQSIFLNGVRSYDFSIERYFQLSETRGLDLMREAGIEVIVWSDEDLNKFSAAVLEVIEEKVGEDPLLDKAIILLKDYMKLLGYL